jgi:hypothetical protein
MDVKEVCDQIAAKTVDYRPLSGAMDGEYVMNWAGQFPEAGRLPLLLELGHILDRTYVSQSDWETFVKELLTTEQLVGSDPVAFWRGVNFCKDQKRGNSQREMLEVFDGVLSQTLGFSITDCGSDEGPWVYLDDGIFTGTHVRWDLLDFIRGPAPQTCVLHIIAIALHSGRAQYTEKELHKAAKEAGKKLTTKWWRAKEFETRPWRDTEVLFPSALPDDPYVAKLVEQLKELKQPPKLRTVVTASANGVFSGDGARNLLERELLIAGCRLKYELAPYLKENHWPLGYDVFKCMGFGSMLVTFRNCPNNCPLALWCGDPWIPLFPRDTN